MSGQVLSLLPGVGPVLSVPPALGAVLAVPPATGDVLSLPIPDAGGIPSTLLEGLESYWSFDTDWKDLVGSNHLTNHNGVTAVAGKLGNAGDFEADLTQYLSHPDPAPLGDEDWTYALWFKRESLVTGFQALLTKGDDGSNRHYLVYFDPNFTDLWFTIEPAGITVRSATITDTNWHFVVLGHNKATKTLIIQIDNGDVRFNTYGGTFTPPALNTPVMIGARPVVGQPFDGLIDDVALWRRVLTAAERTALYHAGLGLAYPFIVPDASPLLTGLESYWSFDAGWTDLVGTNHLTNVNGVTAVPGKLGKAGDFEASSSQYLSHPDSQQLGDTTWTYALWVKLEATGVTQPLVDKYVGYAVYIADWGSVYFYIGDSNPGQVAALVPITNTNWHYVVFWHDATANTINIQIDNGAVSTANTTGPVPSYASPVTFGRQSTLYFDGLMDDIALWRRVLTAQERTQLYNEGRGLAYPFQPPAFPSAGLVSYWALDEASGVRFDRHGGNDLTPTNAPVGAPGKLGGGCDFEASSSQYLSHPDPNPLGDEDFTYALWFKRESTGVNAQLITKDSNVGRSFTLGIETHLGFYLGDGATAYVTAPGPGSDTNWHFVVAWHDAAANTINLQVDNGVINSDPTGGVYPLNYPALSVRIGAREYSGAQDYFDGIIDDVGFWKRVLTADERTRLWNDGNGLAYPASYQQAVLGDGPTAYWPLDDAEGLVAKDLAGSRHGTISGGVTLGVEGVGDDVAMQFTGPDGQGKVLTQPLTIPAICTIEAWVKNTAPQGGGHVAVCSTRTDGSTGDAVYFGITTPAHASYVYWSPGFQKIGVTPLAQDAWYHLVAVFDGTQLLVYVNGGMDGTPYSTVRSGPTVGSIGIGFDLPANTWWLGALADVAIYPRALTPAEITAHYALRVP